MGYLLILSLVVIQPVAAWAVENIELKTCIPGLCGEAVVAGDLIYSATTSGLLILNGSDPEHPRKVSFHPVPGDGGAVALQGGYAYFTSSYFSDFGGTGGLTVIDITDSAHPFTVGNCGAPQHPRQVAVGDEYAYVGDSGGLRIIDIGDPTDPVEVVFLPISNQNIHLELVGTLLFCSFDFSGLRIFDMSDPLDPMEIGSVGGMGNIRGLTVRGDYAYITGGSRGIHIVDVSDPVEPFIVGDCHLDFDIHYGTASGDIALVGDHAYVTIGSYGVAVADIGDPTAPFELVYHELRGSAHGIEIQDDRIYVSASYGGLCILEIRKPDTLIDLGQYQMSGYVTDIEMVNGLLYVNGGYVAPEEYRGDGERPFYSWAGLYLFDITEPSAPRFTGFQTTYYPNPSQVAVSDDVAYVTSEWTGLRIIDTEDPYNPHELTYVEHHMHRADAVQVRGDVAYVISSSGMVVLDIGNPARPEEIGVFVPDGVIWDISLQGDYIYGRGNSPSLQVIDISDPANPKGVAELEIDSNCFGIKAAGDDLYIANSLYGLCRIDISDPLNPVWSGNIELEGFPQAVDVQDGFAYVTGVFGCGLRIIDIHDPLNMQEVAYSALPEEGHFIDVDDRLICVGDGFAGVWLLEHTTSTGIEPTPELPRSHALGQNFPNPFNPTTTISYDLHTSTGVTLAIFDVAGRLVRTLVDGVIPAGYHLAVWDGTDKGNRQVSSGIYLYRLQTESFTATRSMVLLN